MFFGAELAHAWVGGAASNSSRWNPSTALFVDLFPERGRDRAILDFRGSGRRVALSVLLAAHLGRRGIVAAAEGVIEVR